MSLSLKLLVYLAKKMNGRFEAQEKLMNLFEISSRGSSRPHWLMADENTGDEAAVCAGKE
jgi:hypothetical protein